LSFKQAPNGDFTVGSESIAQPESSEYVSYETYMVASSFGSPNDLTDTEYTATSTPDSLYESSFDSTFETSGATDTSTSFAAINTASTDAIETEAGGLAEQEAHSQAAADAQSAVDEFVASGDYAAAAEAREIAETEAAAAGDTSMLGAYDAQDLTNAAESQEETAYYEAQQAEYAQAGDYEAAREAAGNAAYATYEADTTAGGDDHTGQADAEYQKMDMAAWEQDIADDKMQNAVDYAADGDYETAEIYAASAADHQELADDFGDQGEHGGDFGVYDPSSDVSSGGTYDSTYDSYASSTTMVDSNYDSGTDDL
jgi:hypothetical protein